MEKSYTLFQTSFENETCKGGTINAKGFTGMFKGDDRFGFARKLTIALVVMFGLLFQAKDAKAITQTYNIALGNLINCTSNCGSTNSWYNGCAGAVPGFSWTDVIPAGGVVTSVTIQFSIGVDCNGGVHTTSLNGTAQGNYSTVYQCGCDGSTNPVQSVTINAANYTRGGTNTFLLTNPISCLGFIPDAGTLGGYYARVTVNYVTDPFACGWTGVNNSYTHYGETRIVPPCDGSSVTAVTGSGTYQYMTLYNGSTYQVTTDGSSPFTPWLTIYDANPAWTAKTYGSGTLNYTSTYTGDHILITNRAGCGQHDFTGQSAVLKIREVVNAGTITPSAATTCVGTAVNFNITGKTGTSHVWMGLATGVNSGALVGGWNECDNCILGSSFSRTFNTPGIYLIRTHAYGTGSGCPNWNSYSDCYVTVYARPVSGALTLNGTAGNITVCPGNVTIAQSGGSFPNANYWYWIGPDNGTGWVNSWDQMNQGNANTASFTYNFTTPGNYVIHTNANSAECGWTLSGGVTRLLRVNSATNNPGTIGLSTASSCLGSGVTVTNVTAASTGTPASAGPTYYYYWQRTSAPTTGWNMYESTTNTTSSLPAAVTGTAGTYIITRNSEFGCASQTSANTVNLTVNALPTVSASLSPTAICVGGSSTLSASATANGGTITNYAWSSGLGNVASGSVSPASTTNYTVTVTTSNGCTAASGAATLTVNMRPLTTSGPTASPSSICPGGSSTLNPFATAGSGTITNYAWSAGLGNVATGSVSPASTTTYSVTVTNSNGCTLVITPMTVTVNAVPSAAPSLSPTAICAGNSSTLTANASPGSGTITNYAWSAGLGNVASGSVSPGTTTGYTVTITNSNGCTGVSSAATLTVNARPTSTPTLSPTAICSGGTSTLNANAAAGSGTITNYQWSAGASFGNAPSGTVTATANAGYQVTVTNSNGCTIIGGPANLTVNANPTAAPSLSPTAICAGGSSTLSANAAAGSGTITNYAWSAGLGNVASGSVSPAGTTAYTVTVTNSNGCTIVSGAATLTVNARPTSAPSLSPTAICPGGSSTLNANAAAGSGTITNYAWSAGLGNVASGSVSPAGTTAYSVTVTNSNGCTIVGGPATLTINAIPTAAPSLSPTSICPGGSSTLSANAAAGSGTITNYAWSSGLGNVASGTVSPGSATTYTVTVTNSNGCTAVSAGVTLNINANPSTSPSLSAPSACAGSPVTLSANASAGSGTITSYAWSAGLGNVASGTVSPAGTTSYTVTVTNSNGCTAVGGPVTLTINSAPSAAPTVATSSPSASCSNSLPGTITLIASGGNPGTGGTANWYTDGCGTTFLSNGSSPTVVNPGATTTYYVRYENSCGSSACAQVTYTVNPTPTAGISGNTAICSGGSTTLTATGGTSYAWSNGPTTATNTVSSAGTYTVTVTGTGGCTATASTTTTITALPTAGITGNTAICAGGSTTLTATGGGTYAWSNGPATAGNTVSAAGTYTVTVTNNGCTATASATTTITALPTAGITGNTAICAGGSTTLTATGGGTYAWSNGPATAGNTVSAAGTYTVTVTNNGCTATASATTTITALPTAGISGNTAICSGGSTTLTATGGTSYVWSNGPTTATNTVSSAGTYTVTVTGTGSCTATASATTTISANPSAAPSLLAGTICSGGSTTLSANATAGSGTITDYTWSAGLGNVASGSVNPTNTTSYSVTVTNSNGCTATGGPVTLTVAGGLAVSLAETNGDAGGCSGDAFSLTASGSGGLGTPGYQFQRYISGVWTNTGGNSSNPVFSTGPVVNTGGSDIIASYRVIYTTSGGGCGSGTSNEVDLTVFAKPTAEPEFDDCAAQLAGTKYSYIILSNSGSAPPFHVNDSTNLGAVKMYSDIDTSYLIYRLPQDGSNTEYVFTTTDANGCSVTSTFMRETTYPNTIVTANTSGTTVNECQLRGWNEWEHFQNPNNKDEVIMSVNPKGVDLGKVTVSSYVDAPGISVMNSGSTCTGTAQAAMRRHYKVTSSAFAPGEAFTNGANVGVRLYFSNADFADLSNRAAANDDANNSCTTDDNITDMAELFVTKYSDNTGSGTENGTYADNDPAMGIYKVFGPGRPNSAATYAGPVSAMQANGFDAVFQPQTATGHHYIDLDVTEFSEFWLHGSGSGSPLPVKMLFIEAKGVDNTFIRTSWATSTEIDNWKFEVERSEDGKTFTKIGEVIGHATTTERQDYLYNDLTTRQGVRYYYRLKQIDFDGKYEYTPIVSAILDIDDAFSVGEFVPNPTSGRSTLIFKTKANKEVKAQVVNYLGAVVMEQTKTIRNADNTMYFDFDKLAAGTYMVTLSTADKNYTKRVVLTR